MNKPLHPQGIHRLKLILVNKSSFGPMFAQCIFSGTGANKGCYTISRLISKYGRWGDTSQGFLDQLEGMDQEQDMVTEIRKFIGQDFICRIPKQGQKNQMNISLFLGTAPNINSTSHSTDETLSGQLHEPG